MKLETLNEIKKMVEAGHRKFILKTSNGAEEVKRLAISSGGQLMYFKKRSKRFGYPLDEYCNEFLDYFKPVRKMTKKYTAAEEYANELLKHKKYMEKNLHPNLRTYWEHDLESINDENIKRFIEAGNINSHFDAWGKAHEYNLPRMERHKTLTLKTCLPKGQSEYVLREIKDALDNKKEYSYFWRNKYDYTLEITFKNGIGRAWLSQEFKNCGNGHYWLVISENHCIFCEDD